MQTTSEKGPAVASVKAVTNMRIRSVLADSGVRSGCYARSPTAVQLRIMNARGRFRRNQRGSGSKNRGTERRRELSIK